MQENMKKRILYFSIFVLLVGIILIGVGEGMKKQIGTDITTRLNQKIADVLKSGGTNDKATQEKIMSEFFQENVSALKSIETYDKVSMAGVILSPIAGFVVLIFMIMYFIEKKKSMSTSAAYGRSKSRR